jgi:hypothetical protein
MQEPSSVQPYLLPWTRGNCWCRWPDHARSVGERRSRGLVQDVICDLDPLGYHERGDEVYCCFTARTETL